jgi:hypothetical protein
VDLKQEFGNLLKNGFHDAELTHSAIFNENGPKENSVITGYLSIANSYINAAKAVYICNADLAKPEISDFFAEFDSFSDEVMANISSIVPLGNIAVVPKHQWTDKHFPKLKKVFQTIA